MKAVDFGVREFPLCSASHATQVCSSFSYGFSGMAFLRPKLCFTHLYASRTLDFALRCATLREQCRLSIHSGYLGHLYLLQDPLPCKTYTDKQLSVENFLASVQVACSSCTKASCWTAHAASSIRTWLALYSIRYDLWFSKSASREEHVL